jgi:hypothetical protein
MVDRDKLREGGFSEKEIDEIDAYCIAQVEAGKLDNTAALILFNGKPMFVCETVARAMRNVCRRAKAKGGMNAGRSRLRRRKGWIGFPVDRETDLREYLRVWDKQRLAAAATAVLVDESQ